MTSAEEERSEDWKTGGPGGLPIPLNVSWHLWPDCNLSCTYCFATFRDVPGTLDRDAALRVLDLLREAGTEKVTFVGGEPTLCPHLPELIKHAKRIGFTTMLVTNGTGFRSDNLHELVRQLDWVSLSIDASTPELMATMGRGGPGVWKHCIDCWAELAACDHLRLKVNTVVTRQNLHDDMSDLIRRLRPSRWKVFQVLPVAGQNDGLVEPLLVKDAEFSEYVARHMPLAAEGLGPVCETNADLTGTYLMLDPLGRFFSNKSGGHEYTRSLLDIGVWKALRDVGWDVAGFEERGGLYDWKPTA